METATIETFKYGTGRIERLFFHPNAKPFWLATFPGIGRVYVEAKDLVSIDSRFNLN